MMPFKESAIDPALMRQLVDYDPDTGAMYWRRRPVGMFSHGRHTQERSARIWNAQNAGRKIENRSSNGYLSVHVGVGGRRSILAHRVAWCLFYGEWPSGMIDHMNGERDDNRIANLRIASPSENGRNRRKNVTNTSGCKGVYFCKQKRRWRAFMKLDGKVLHFGYHKTIEAAKEARAAAEAQHGFFDPAALRDAPAIRRKIEAALEDVERIKGDDVQ